MIGGQTVFTMGLMLTSFQTVSNQLPFLTGCTNILHEKMIFSTIDLIKAYQHIPIPEANILKTNIITFSLSEFSFMHLVCETAQIFQRFMNTMLSNVDFVFNYLDGILITFPNKEKHTKKSCISILKAQ